MVRKIPLWILQCFVGYDMIYSLGRCDFLIQQIGRIYAAHTRTYFRCDLQFQYCRELAHHLCFFDSPQPGWFLPSKKTHRCAKTCGFGQQKNCEVKPKRNASWATQPCYKSFTSGRQGNWRLIPKKKQLWTNWEWWKTWMNRPCWKKLVIDTVEFPVVDIGCGVGKKMLSAIFVFCVEVSVFAYLLTLNQPNLSMMTMSSKLSLQLTGLINLSLPVSMHIL